MLSSAILVPKVSLARDVKVVYSRGAERLRCSKGNRERRRTFEELATVDLTGCDFESNDMSLSKKESESATIKRGEDGGEMNGGVVRAVKTNLRLVQQLDWDTDCARHDG